MKQFRSEIRESFNVFSGSWDAQLHTIRTELAKSNEKYYKSYGRLVSLQAWRQDVLQAKLDGDSLAFYLEAQNDCLVSHVLAHFGSWRSALKSLRSAIENVTFCLYYKDHPVELLQWLQGKHRLAFSEIMSYLKHHPEIIGRSPKITGLTELQKEYSTLSKAVHGSAKSFRMTKDAKGSLLWSAEKPRLNQWATRERIVVRSINLLLITFFHTEIETTRLPNLRKAISLTIPASYYSNIKQSFKVHLTKV